MSLVAENAFRSDPFVLATFFLSSSLRFHLMVSLFIIFLIHFLRSEFHHHNFIYYVKQPDKLTNKLQTKRERVCRFKNFSHEREFDTARCAMDSLTFLLDLGNSPSRHCN